MALATYADLKASIAAWATRSDLTTTIPDFVTWADEEIARRVRCNAMLASVDLALTAEMVAQPTGFLGLRSLYLDISPRQEIGVIASTLAVQRNTLFSTGTYPDSVAVEGANLRFSPQFTSITTIGKLVYYKRQVAMVADSDTNTIYAAYPYLYLFGALEALFLFLEDDNNADRYGQRFGSLIDNVNDQAAKDEMRGPIRPMASGGIVV